MPAPSWESLDDFLSTDDFAVSAVIETQDGATRTVSGIFDDPYLNAQLGEYEMDTSKPRLLCKEVDLAGVDRGDQVTIGGKTYDVLTGPQSDGTGMALMELVVT